MSKLSRPETIRRSGKIEKGLHQETMCCDISTWIRNDLVLVVRLRVIRHQTTHRDGSQVWARVQRQASGRPSDHQHSSGPDHHGGSDHVVVVAGGGGRDPVQQHAHVPAPGPAAGPVRVPAEQWADPKLHPRDLLRSAWSPVHHLGWSDTNSQCHTTRGCLVITQGFPLYNHHQ